MLIITNISLSYYIITEISLTQLTNKSLLFTLLLQKSHFPSFSLLFFKIFYFTITKISFLFFSIITKISPLGKLENFK